MRILLSLFLSSLLGTSVLAAGLEEGTYECNIKDNRSSYVFEATQKFTLRWFNFVDQNQNTIKTLYLERDWNSIATDKGQVIDESIYSQKGFPVVTYRADGAITLFLKSEVAIFFPDNTINSVAGPCLKK